jgi:cytochrome c oxidase subunit IV
MAMAKELQEVNYRIYWFTWLLLLILTLVMISVGYAAVPKILIVLFLLLAMFLKIGLIGGYFMHLRYEKPTLIVTVAGGILLTAAVLFFLLIPDGLRVLHLSGR